MCFMFAPASKWKEGIEWIAHHTHSDSDVKQYMQLSWSVIVLTSLHWEKSKQPWSKDRMFLTCYQKECNFFIWIDQPISHGIKEQLSYSPQPQLARFHPCGGIKETFKKWRQDAKQKAFVQHQHHTREDEGGFLMCDNGFNSLWSPTIFRRLRYRKWMPEVWESYKLYIQRMKEDFLDPTLSLEKNDLVGQRRITSTQVTAVISSKVTECWRLSVWKTHRIQTSTFSAFKKFHQP